LVVGESAWTWRLLALVAILLMTLPLASHALARAGVIERERAQKAASNLPGRP
jgi:multisubunit Na+/H+ antiporter MnhG subunit